MLTFLTSQKGKSQILYQKYLYRFIYTVGNYKHFRCNNKTCNVIIKIDEKNEVVNNGEILIHKEAELNGTKIKALISLNKITEMAKHTELRTNKILSIELANLDPNEQMFLPQTRTIKDRIRRIKKQNFKFTEKENDYADENKKTNSGYNFLLYDTNSNDSERILIFCNEQYYDSITTTNCLIMDGTFYSAPRNFAQLYIIHFTKFGKPYPGIYIFLKDKKEETYKKMFRILKKKFVFSNLQHVLLDFEQAPINAVTLLNPKLKIYNCIFHLGQNILKHLKEKGLYKEYRDNTVFRIYIKMLLNLAFVPVFNVINTYRLIIAKINEKFNSKNVVEFIEYFEKYYIINNKFESWNCFNRIHSNIPFTTNHCEGYNNSLNICLNNSNPTLITILFIIQEKDACVEREYNKNLISRKFECVNKDKTLVDLMVKYESYTLFEYIQAISYYKCYLVE